MGCENWDQDSIYVDDCVGINEIASDEMVVNLYPNPSAGLVQLTFPEPLKIESQLVLRNAAGVLLWQSKLPANIQQHSLDLQGLAPGMYFIEMISTESRLVQKLVIE